MNPETILYRYFTYWAINSVSIAKDGTVIVKVRHKKNINRVKNILKEHGFESIVGL